MSYTRDSQRHSVGRVWMILAGLLLAVATGGTVRAEDEDARRQQIIEYVQANPDSVIADALREAHRNAGADTSAQTDPAAAAPPAPHSSDDASPPDAAKADADADADTDDATADAAAAVPVVGWLELSGPLRDGPIPFAWVGEDEADASLHDVVNQLDTVAHGAQYLGVVLYLDQPELTMTQIATVGQAMQRVRDTGKTVMTFSVSYDLLSYTLASYADQILLQHRGSVELAGLALEEMYLAGLLEKVGAKADLIQIGDFKGAQDPMVGTEPSEAWNRNMDALLDGLYAQIIGRIAEGRQMTEAQVEAILRDVWTMSDADYLRRRVVDRLTDRDLVAITEIAFGERFVWDDRMGRGDTSGMQADNPFAFMQMLFQDSGNRPRTTRPSIAVIHAHGPIISGDSARGDGLFSSDAIGSRTLVRLLGEVRDDPQIQGVVVRIDSPGGSALASEVIWQAVRDLGEHKPVYSSVDTLAASGGYYIACATDRIYVSDHSIVGSIGVVGGKIVLGGLYEKLGINVHRRTRGPLADMLNSVEPFTPPQREALTKAMQRTYDQFIDRVEIGRGRRIANIDQVAQGRLFTGAQAVTNGLADQAGGLDEAVTALAAQLNLEPGSYDVINLPGPMSLGEFIGSIFGAHGPTSSAQAPPLLNLARQALGPQRWQVASRTLQGIMLLQNEPTLTLMPHVIIVK